MCAARFVSHSALISRQIALITRLFQVPRHLLSVLPVSFHVNKTTAFAQFLRLIIQACFRGDIWRAKLIVFYS